MRKLNLIRTILLALCVPLALACMPSPASAQIAVGISVHVGPPALPVYVQPACPTEGFLWTPGYWAYGNAGYYWVPGVWVRPPRVGVLWTPGYWGYAGGMYGWHAGYWGPHVGFYGGINYGFGYGGVGFAGGEWRGGTFFYNRSVMNVNVTNVYNRTVIVNNTHVAFNGPGGVEARPTPQEEAFAREPHTPALSAQTEHEHAASQNRQLFASENHGRPAIAATGRPGEFSGHNVVRASAAGEEYHAPKMSPQEARGAAPRNETAKNGGMEHNPARENSHHNSEPSKQDKQTQKKAQKQAKAEQKH